MTAFLIGLCTLGSAFLDAVIDSITVKEARIDLVYGQKDLQLFQNMFYAIVSSMGSIIAAICIDNKKPFLCIGLASILPAIIIIINLFGTGET